MTCRSRLAGDWYTAVNPSLRVIVNDHRQQAGSYTSTHFYQAAIKA
jgi:hypothetical protein